MNWKEINKTSPTAKKKYEMWIDAECDGQKKFANDRMLYDFFDEQGIKVYIVPCNDYKWNLSTNAFKIVVDVIDEQGIELRQPDILQNDQYHREKVFNNRTEAETQAFTRAFEILEKRLEGE